MPLDTDTADEPALIRPPLEVKEYPSTGINEPWRSTDPTEPTILVQNAADIVYASQLQDAVSWGDGVSASSDADLRPLMKMMHSGREEILSDQTILIRAEVFSLFTYPDCASAELAGERSMQRWQTALRMSLGQAGTMADFAPGHLQTTIFEREATGRTTIATVTEDLSDDQNSLENTIYRAIFDSLILRDFAVGRITL